MLKLRMLLDAVKAMENVQRDAIVSWIEFGERGGCQGGIHGSGAAKLDATHVALERCNPDWPSGFRQKRSFFCRFAETFGALRFIMQLSLPAARNGNMLFLCSSNW